MGQTDEADRCGYSPALLEVSHLGKVYRSRARDVQALDDVNFSVGSNQVVGLLGPNGAGKTTTIKSICGLIRPSTGRVMVGGVDVASSPRAASRLMAAVLEGNRTVYWRLSVRENLEYFAALRGLRRRDVRDRIDELIERFHLEAKASTPAMRLSRGMQQKLAVACAVLPGTPLLLLDEPTLGLDVETSHELRGYLKQLASDEGKTILLSSHDMQVVRDVCERVVIINGGRVVADDTIANLIAVFRTRAFRITLGHAVAPAARGRLAERFPMCQVRTTTIAAPGEIETRSEIRTEIEVGVSNSPDFYDLVAMLRAEGAVVESIESTEPDLEKVFLSIVRHGPAR